ncbi:hypothetical protein ACX80V_17990 [Arthrobacter sp. MDT3-24]
MNSGTSGFELVGFVADLVGNEGHFITAEAVIKFDEEVYVAPTSSEWRTHDLRRVGADQRDFIYWFPQTSSIFIDEGQSIWLAGPQFVSKLAQASPLKLGEFRSQFLAWAGFRKYRWTIGTDAGFQSLNLRLARSIEQLLHQILFDSSASSFGNADILYDLFSVLDVPGRPEFELTKALYFDEKRDEYSKTFVIENAILDGIFRNHWAFTLKLRAMKARLRRARLRDTKKTNPHPLKQGLLAITRSHEEVTAATVVFDRIRLDISKSLAAGLPSHGNYANAKVKILAAAMEIETLDHSNSILEVGTYLQIKNGWTVNRNMLIRDADMWKPMTKTRGDYGSQ